MVEDSLTIDPALGKRLSQVVGQDPDAFLDLIDRIVATYEKAARSGESDPAKLRDAITKELAGVPGETPKVSEKPGATLPAELPRQSRPAEPAREPGTAENAQVAQHVVQQLNNAGIPVNVLQARAGELAQDLGRSMGSYDRATKTINWALSDLSQPKSLDMRVLFEETTHALFDREGKEVTDPILRAISGLEQRTPAELEAVKVDIANAYPEGIRPEVYQEELMAGWLSRKLQAEGFNPIQAHGIGQSIVRMLKEIYLKAAMWFQKTFIGDEYDNPDLALRHFQNRLESFMAGDVNPVSWITALGGAKAPHDLQVRWHEAVTGGKDLIQTYNRQTGLIDTAHLTEDSVAAALLNIRGDQMRYASPVPGAPPQPFIDPSTGIIRDVAANNEVRATRGVIADFLHIPTEKFRKLFRLSDRDKVAQLHNEDAAHKGVPGFNPDTRLADLQNPESVKAAGFHAVKILNSEFGTVGRILAKDKESLKRIEERLPSVMVERERLLKEYTDADVMADTIAKGFRSLTLDTIRQEYRASKRLGTIGQIYRQLTGEIDKPVDPRFVNALRRLFQGPELQGQNLFEILDRMARDPGIDFTRPATSIRAYIKSMVEPGMPPNDLYERLSHDSVEGKALLSAVIAYGKVHQRVLAHLEMRHIPVGEERAALEQKVKDLWKETTQQLTEGIRRVTRTAKLEERAKIEYRKLLREEIIDKRAKEHLESRIAAAEQALPAYQKALDTIAPKIGQASPASFQDQMEIRLPVNPTEVHPSEYKTVTVNLGAATGSLTDLTPIMENMVTWLAVRQAAAKAGDMTALNAEYETVNQQLNSIIKNRFYDSFVRNTDQKTTGLVIAHTGAELESIGTPAARKLAELFNRKHSLEGILRNQADNLYGQKSLRFKRNAIGVLNEGQSWYKKKKVEPGWFDSNIRNPAKGFLGEIQWTEGGRNNEAELSAAYKQLGDWLISQPHIRPVIADRMPKFMAALREYLENEYQAGQWYIKKNEESGLRVKDPKLKVGGVEQLRFPIESGIRTFHREFAPAFSAMVHALQFSGWAHAADEFSKFAANWAEDKAAAVQKIAKFFDKAEHTDTIQNDYLYELTHVPGKSVFKTPAIDEAGTTLDAKPRLVAQAYDETGGKVVPMLERLYQLQGGTGDAGEYIQSQLLVLAEEAKKAMGVVNKIEPKGDVNVSSLRGLIPNAMIDAREFEHWPNRWFNYPDFDPNENARMAERVAGQIVYGRETADLANIFEVVSSESKAFVNKYDVIEKEAAHYVPSGNKTEIKSNMERLLAQDKMPGLQSFKTGKERLDFLKKQKERAPLLQKFLKEYPDYYRRGSDQLANLRWGIRLSQYLSGLMVSNPASAISQMATTTDIPAQWGVSPMTLEATRQAIKFTAKDVAGGLSQAIGIGFMKLDPYEQAYLDMKLNPPVVDRRFGDLFSVETGEQGKPWSRIFRIAKEAQAFTLNPKGAEAKFTPTMPLSLFFQSVHNSNRGLTIGLWKMADRFVAKGVQALKGGATEINAKTMKLGKADAESFELWKADAARFGFRFEETVKNAAERVTNGDGTLLTTAERGRLYALGLHKISLEPSPITMNLAAYNNNLIRFLSPLLGWQWRRSWQAVSRLGGLDANDKRSLKSVRNAILGFAATGLGGLGLSLAVDAYQEDVLGKKRNIRPLRFPTTASDLVAINERLNRVGTFGIWGDMLNSAVNVGTGQGDNRMFSMDQRVVALQSFQTIQRAIASFINQDFDADYQHVVRPLIASLGGNGMLQYMQIANHAFDFDNVESRTVKRINAQNYLRVVGRDLGMSMRGGTGAGAYYTPTPMTPWIARMEYAAYANNPGDFRAAWQGAKAEAIRSGKPNPESYVKQAFEQRHPLRYVFAQTPSERDYRLILANLDEHGQQDVQDAVRLFNYYGSHLGLTPFTGSAKKDQQRSTNPAMRARAMALSH